MKKPYNRRRGMALIIVLFLSSILTLLMYTFLKEMQVESSLTSGFAREKQAQHLAWSAIERAMAVLAAETTPVAGPSSTWYENPTDWYEAEVIATDPRGASTAIGVYSMIRATLDPDGKLHYGLADEASKINLNVVPRDVLMKLPKMTDEIADSILDWRDADENPGASGAENAYYQVLAPAYACKNGVFDTVEELLYVRGVTPELLFGEDINQNGVLDQNENDGEKSAPVDNSDGVLDFGFAAYLTVHSSDKNTRNDGQPRVNINTGSPQDLQTALGDVLSPQELGAIPTRRVLLMGFKSSAQLMTVAGVPTPGIPPAKWKQVVDRVTIFDGDSVQGLLNVNTAGRKILEMLPGLTADDISKMVAHRTLPDTDLSTLGWLADVLTPDKIQGFGAFVTTRSYQFRFDAVARIGPKSTRAADDTTALSLEAGKPPPAARAIRRIVVIWDRGTTPPRVLYSRDVSRLGLPYPVLEPSP